MLKVTFLEVSLKYNRFDTKNKSQFKQLLKLCSSCAITDNFAGCFLTVERYLREVKCQNNNAAQGVHAIPLGTHVRDDEQVNNTLFPVLNTVYANSECYLETSIYQSCRTKCSETLTD